jgi:glycosyltransferase involved in cell wall biosynthesis
MTNVICLDEKYSTTRLMTKEKQEIVNNPEDKFESVLFLPEGEGRKGEGGLRTQGYFKKSYEDKPLISIITVVFNGEQFLEETILSVINQTYNNVEYIIIDGGSTDGTVDIIKKYEDKIDYWVSEKDSGIYDAMNKGVDMASGEWINFMNAGDSLYNHDVIENVFKNSSGKNMIVHGKVALYYQDDLISYYGNKKIIPHQGAFFRTKIMKNLKFNEDYKIFADGECLSRIQKLEDYKAQFIDVVIANFELGGVGNHPKYFFKRFKEELKIKQDKKENIFLKWYILKLIEFFGYIIYYLCGEKFYYTHFQKQLLKALGENYES